MFVLLFLVVGIAGAANFSDFRCFCYCKSKDTVMRKVTLEADKCQCSNPAVLPDTHEGLCDNFCNCQKQYRNTTIIKAVVLSTICAVIGSFASLVYMVIIRPCLSNQRHRPSLDITKPGIIDWSDTEGLVTTMNDSLDMGLNELVDSLPSSPQPERIGVFALPEGSTCQEPNAQRRRSVVELWEEAQNAWMRRLSIQQDNVYHSKKLLN